MSCELSPSPVAVATKKTVTPTRRAVEYLKGTWRRVIKTPKTTARHLQISSPVPIRRPAGVCLDRTQLNDVVDDDDLTIIPSNISHGASTSSSQPSPAIQDSDWRHFIDTPIQTSPSTFLGSWSKSLHASGRLVRSRSSSVLTSSFSIVDSVHSARSKCNASEVEGGPHPYATPPKSAINRSKKASFLRRREMAQDSNDGSSVSVATPTPAVRPSHRSLHRRVSDSIIGTTTIADLDKPTGDIHMEDESGSRSQLVSADVSDKWSFVSVRGESTTNDLLQYDTHDLPASKRRKVSTTSIQENQYRTSIKKEAEPRPDRPDTPRNHPRYSGVYTLDPNRRVLNTAHGPAVLMSSSPGVLV
ncbi:hypothetical protein SCARD494_09418 [Seiridium cardinale]